MTFTVELSAHRGATRRVVLGGRLDPSTADELEQAVQDLITDPPGCVVFDMEYLEYVSSAGLRVIFRVQKAVKGVGGEVLMVNLQSPVQKVFEIIDALPSMAVFKSYEEMDEYLDVMQRRESERQRGG